MGKRCQARCRRGACGLAEVTYQRNQLEDALRHITEGIDLFRRTAFHQPLGNGLATLAWIRQTYGDTAGAQEAIGEAARTAPRLAVADLVNPVPAQRARLLLAQGDIAGAADWIRQRDLSADDAPGYPREPAYLVLAWVLLAHDRAGRHWRCWSGCSPRPRARAVPEASSRFRPCGR